MRRGLDLREEEKYVGKNISISDVYVPQLPKLTDNNVNQSEQKWICTVNLGQKGGKLSGVELMINP